MQKWFVVETHLREEFRAQVNLRRQEFVNFLPQFLRTQNRARKITQVLVPVFPGYVFVRFDPDRDSWRAINSTFGVRRLVSFAGDRPQAMPEAAMDALLARCDAELIVRQLPQLAIGDEVRIVSGPLADRIGLIENFDAKGRVAILMDLLGRAMRVKVDPKYLGPIAC